MIFSLELCWILTEYPKRYLFKVSESKGNTFFRVHNTSADKCFFRAYKSRAGGLKRIYESENNSCSSYLLGWLGSFVFLVKVLKLDWLKCNGRNLPTGMETRKANTRAVFILEGSITPLDSACKMLWCSLTMD